jgi:6-hydroxycyclohex-1-ene-1-carbonyl-CoA dehydrogenase
MEARGTRLVPREWRLDRLDDDQVLIEVAGCGVCRGDLEVLAGGARWGGPLPLALGHEIAGTVVDAGSGAAGWLNRQVVVPTLIPCNRCHHCRADDGGSCIRPLRVGCDTHGGFASHVVLPARGLCAVDSDELARSGIALADLAVLAEAATAPYEAITRSRLQAGEVAVVVGAGDTGGFAIQIAAVLDAYVIALDTDDRALERAAQLGAAHTMNLGGRDPASVRRALRDHARVHDLRGCCWKIFETSGTAAGELVAFELMTEGSVLALVGQRSDQVVPVRLGQLAALDATAHGLRVHAAEHVLAALDLIVAGDVAIEPLIERRPLGTVNETLQELCDGSLLRRSILVPADL